MLIGGDATLCDGGQALACGGGVDAFEESVHKQVAAGAGEGSEWEWPGYRRGGEDDPCEGDVVGGLAAGGVRPVDHERPTRSEDDVVGVQVEVRELFAASERCAQSGWC